ncbi:MAG: hypothetical protein ACE5H4_02980 [Candidatus Thorarchaeota archaeon]
MSEKADGEERINTRKTSERGPQTIPEVVWGFEGCGAMWTFYEYEADALESSEENRVFEFTIEEAWARDNARRGELGFPSISFDQFLDCIRMHESCYPTDPDCDPN